MNGQEEKLTRLQEDLLAALMTERNIKEAAGKAGVPESTARRWLTLPHVKAAYRRLRRAVVEDAVARLQRSAQDAATALRRNLRCGTPSVKVRSALGILDHAVRGVELVDLAERVEELERCLYGDGARDGDGDAEEAGAAVGGAGEGAEEGDGEPGAGGPQAPG
jgi:hypothetical protein